MLEFLLRVKETKKIHFQNPVHALCVAHRIDDFPHAGFALA